LLVALKPAENEAKQESSMKRWALLCGVMLLSAVAASAQDTPKVEVFGGYSYVHASVSGADFTANLNGGTASVSYNPANWLGLVAEVGGYNGGENSSGVGINGQVYTFLFGPKTTFRIGRFTPFVETLFGGARASANSFYGSSTSFAMATGGGVDCNVSPHIGVRLIQADYLLTELSDTVNNRQNNARISAGIVFRW
jgi:outer membrane immunogenic protein